MVAVKYIVSNFTRTRYVDEILMMMSALS